MCEVAPELGVRLYTVSLLKFGREVSPVSSEREHSKVMENPKFCGSGSELKQHDHENYRVRGGSNILR